MCPNFHCATLQQEQHHLRWILKSTIKVTPLLLLVISCGDPGPVPNGIYLGSDFTFNHTVIYRCNPGHLMEPPGHSVLRCTKEGTWNQTKPSCKGMKDRNSTVTFHSG